MELTPDRSWVRPGNGPVLLAGSPLTLFRLTEGGRRVAEAIEQGRPLPLGHEPLTRRLVAAGAVHPLVTPRADPPAGPDVAVVIPVHDEDPERLDRLVRCLGTSPWVAEVVVVDDASPTAVGPIEGATVVRLPSNVGPGGARRAGIDRVESPVVLMVDADVTVPDPGSLVARLRAHLDDPGVALAAPRVAAARGHGWLAAHDAVRSPLDLGPEPGRVKASTRVSYVPAAVVMARRSALDEIGSFDTGLRFGEDVDLVWRLDEAGWVCRYDPLALAEHTVRPSLRRWCRQRRQYGSAAAPLTRRHPGSAAPLRINRWSAAVWGLIALGRPVLGVGVAAATTVQFARTLGDLPGRASVAARYAGTGHLHAGRLTASAITRSWWPIALAASLFSRRARRVLLASVVVPAAIDWVRQRPRLDPIRWTVLRALDDMSYGTGVWQGCANERSAAALRPDLSATRRRAAR